ncbi:MAG: Eco57I restriction-modification methylase domain-containing protein, partial [Pirellulales bacterium]
VYIVDYIVRETVGKLVDGKTPKQVSKLRVLDPACGSGSFLVGAFHFLLDWHSDWYVEDGTQRHTKEIYQGPGGQWLLTTAEKKRILLNNIFGVDIDSQAVEVTKLSLLLKVLERENRETLERQLRLLHARALPDLGNNVKCGNSLIGPDFYDQRQMTLLDEDEQYRINAFDWHAEFPEIFKGKDGGFDAVIGNPPYVRMEEFKEIKDYLAAKYTVHVARADLYAYFVERAHTLLRPDGRFGMIISNKFIKANYGAPLRKFVTDAAVVQEIADFAGLKVFRGATVRTIVLLTRRRRNGAADGSATRYLAPVPPDVFSEIIAGVLPVSDAVTNRAVALAPSSLSSTEWHLVPDQHQWLLEKLRTRSVSIRELVADRVLWGVKTGLNEAFVITRDQRNAILAANPEAEEIIKPFLFGEDVQRYFVEFQGRWLLYCFHGVEIDRFPAVVEHLRPYRRQLEGRATKQKWYELQQPSVALVPVFNAPKIVYPEIARECQFTIDQSGYFTNNKTFVLPTADPFLLGLLNSRLAFFYFSTTCASLESGNERYLEFRAQYVRGFPVRLAQNGGANADDHEMVDSVNLRLQLAKRIADSRNPDDRTRLARQVETVERR